jgi:hypothetical protein
MFLLKRAEFGVFYADHCGLIVSIFGNVPGIVPENTIKNSLVYQLHFKS